MFSTTKKQSILEPICCILRLGLLQYKDPGTKISIVNNSIIFTLKSRPLDTYLRLLILEEVFSPFRIKFSLMILSTNMVKLKDNILTLIDIYYT